MEGLELEAQREAGLTREQELKEMASEHAIRLSKAHEETNRRLMKKRRELTDAVFRAAKQQLKEFAIRKDYVELLKKKLLIWHSWVMNRLCFMSQTEIRLF